jgi:AcrR family transcriptional regulator
MFKTYFVIDISNEYAQYKSDVPDTPEFGSVIDEPAPPRPKVASPPATRKGQQSAAAFRAAAATVFADIGFLNATVADIAKEAKRSPASFYYHYDSKEGILVALFSDFSDAVKSNAQARFDPGASPREQIDHLTRNFWMTYQNWLPVLSAVFQMSMVDADFYEHWREIRVDAVRAIRLWVIDAQKHGFSKGLDADLAASALAAMLDGFCYVWLAKDGDLPNVKLDAERAQRTLAALCYASLYGAVDEER